MAEGSGRFDRFFAVFVVKVAGAKAARDATAGELAARTAGGRGIERLVEVRSGRVLTAEIGDARCSSFTRTAGKRLRAVVGDGRRLGDVAAEAVKSGRRPFGLSSICASCATSSTPFFRTSSSMRSMSQSECRRTIEGGRSVVGRRSEGVERAVWSMRRGAGEIDKASSLGSTSCASSMLCRRTSSSSSPWPFAAPSPASFLFPLIIAPTPALDDPPSISTLVAELFLLEPDQLHPPCLSLPTLSSGGESNERSKSSSDSDDAPDECEECE